MTFKDYRDDMRQLTDETRTEYLTTDQIQISSSIALPALSGSVRLLEILTEAANAANDYHGISKLFLDKSQKDIFLFPLWEMMILAEAEVKELTETHKKALQVT